MARKPWGAARTQTHTRIPNADKLMTSAPADNPALRYPLIT